jgi:hypothetical protein
MDRASDYWSRIIVKPEHKMPEPSVPSCEGAKESDFTYIFKMLEDRWNTKATQEGFDAAARYFARRSSDHTLYLSLFWTQTYAVIQRTDPFAHNYPPPYHSRWLEYIHDHPDEYERFVNWRNEFRFRTFG